MANRGFDPRALLGDRLGELDKRGQARSSGPGQPRVQQPGRLLVGDAVDLAQLLGDQVRAVQRLVGLLDLRELVLLAFGEPVGVLPQDEAGALELFGDSLLSGAAGFVSHLPADLVERVGRELDDVKWVDAARRVGASLSDRARDRLGHVAGD